ncbi:MAG TPA: alpha/beta fold hydrolase [Anaerolineaceae bacterium]
MANKSGSTISGAARNIGLAVGTAAAAAGWWITYSNLAIDHHVPLRNAIDADHRTAVTPSAGEIGYYEDRHASGRPLLLIHSVNAAASSYEMGPIFSRYRWNRPVFAMDLPGFGFSERSNREYTPRLFHEAILEFLDQVVGEPADLVALSLGSEFAARAARIASEKIHSLALISPTGLGARARNTGQAGQGSETRSEKTYRALSHRLWGRPLFDLIATKASIRFFLKKSFVGEVPVDMVEYAYASSHQPGAHIAPLNFISGKLFTAGILPAFYARLEVPALVLYDQDAFTGFEKLPELLAANEHWQAARIAPTRGLPQFERMDDVAAELDRFWSALPD